MTRPLQRALQWFRSLYRDEEPHARHEWVADRFGNEWCRCGRLREHLIEHSYDEVKARERANDPRPASEDAGRGPVRER